MTEGLERVAIFTDTYAPDLNGVARTLARLDEALTQRGMEVRVFAPDAPEARSHDRVSRYRSVAFWAYPELRLAWPSWARLTDDLGGWRPSLIHAATPFGVGLAARAVARRLGVPFVTSYHTSLSEYARFYQLGAISTPGWSFLRWFHNGGRRTFVPTRAIADDLAARGFARLGIWGRGVDARRFNPGWRRDAIREAVGAGPSDTLVLYVGRVAKEKGIDVLLDAARVVQSTTPNVVFAIVGDGPYDAIARANAPASVRFVGRVTGSRLSTLYASSDLFVFPSTTDTFGNVLLEAMASGLAIVGADVGPTRELLEEGSGVTFEPGSASALASVIHGMAANPSARAVCAAAGLSRARAATWDAVFDELIDGYRVAVDAHGRGRVR